MNWKMYFTFPKVIEKGMKFILNPLANFSSWEIEQNFDSIWEIIYSVQNKQIEMKNITPYGYDGIWHIDYELLKSHFLYKNK